MNTETKTVLIVDDEEALRDSLDFFFEDNGWNTLCAASGEEALEILKKETPDCAIVDIRLPGMDGNTLIDKISKFQPRLACVIYTGSPEYHQPDDIMTLPQVSRQVFAKPIAKLGVLEEALLKQIKKINEMSD